MKIPFIISVIFFSFFLFNGAGDGIFAQKKNIDSLLIILKSDKLDTNKVNSLNELSWGGIYKYWRV